MATAEDIYMKSEPSREMILAAEQIVESDVAASDDLTEALDKEASKKALADAFYLGWKAAPRVSREIVARLLGNDHLATLYQLLFLKLLKSLNESDEGTDKETHKLSAEILAGDNDKVWALACALKAWKNGTSQDLTTILFVWLREEDAREFWKAFLTALIGNLSSSTAT